LTTPAKRVLFAYDDFPSLSTQQSVQGRIWREQAAIRGLMARAEIEISGNHDYDLQVNDKAFYRDLRGGGPLGFGETYIVGKNRRPPGRITPAGV